MRRLWTELNNIDLVSTLDVVPSDGNEIEYDSLDFEDFLEDITETEYKEVSTEEYVYRSADRIGLEGCLKSKEDIIEH